MTGSLTGAAQTNFNGAADLVELVLGFRSCLAVELSDDGGATSSETSEPLLAFALGMVSFARRLEALVISSAAAPAREAPRPAGGELRELLR